MTRHFSSGVSIWLCAADQVAFWVTSIISPAGSLRFGIYHMVYVRYFNETRHVALDDSVQLPSSPIGTVTHYIHYSGVHAKWLQL
ncbi:hypothetical protein ASPSYDRAFT_1152678 [Aspergillus sydowii CBS 593.65]|uniref:Uncharacterized protein n=1 Tax=Aspergillus sydowii CBS 593.65 TaxID=1036612 RepID=A0A1L9TBB8_9EURO|nr:uncharacterized protein ASPSYDRAFT_1152678 [Aspergillus sydowii CBS 593.65]OJJ56730.1 hypothetical protein ASPSYDRAFT_1152678 [Aspergillus sydowii CBS 593.65]